MSGYGWTIVAVLGFILWVVIGLALAIIVMTA